MALSCPKEDCKGMVKKPSNYGESAWHCPECGEDWFIMNVTSILDRKRMEKLKEEV